VGHRSIRTVGCERTEKEENWISAASGTTIGTLTGILVTFLRTDDETCERAGRHGINREGGSGSFEGRNQ